MDQPMPPAAERSPASGRGDVDKAKAADTTGGSTTYGSVRNLHGGSGSSSTLFKPSRTALTAALVVVIALGSANSLMYKIMFAAYGKPQAFFVSTGVNALYIVYGGLILYPRMLLTTRSPEMTRLPKTRFLVMGVLDCCGTFLAAMGAFYTPGQVQSLLNQTLIPCTMLCSAIYLRTRFSSVQLFGAALVLLGALFTVVAPSLGQTGATATANAAPTVTGRWSAELLYFLSNIPVACSQVYKEKSFKADQVDVIYLTQWVSIFQFAFGLLLAPLLTVPGVGSARGASMAQVQMAFGAGWRCFLESDAACAHRHTFALLTGYCALNIVYNTAGLYVAKHGSAALNVLTYALLLPLTTLLFSVRPLLGPYTEPLRASTLVGLVVVILGFVIYQRPALAKEEEETVRRRSEPRRGRQGEERPLVSQFTAPASPTLPREATTAMGLHVPSFQERVVAGLGPAIHVVALSASPALLPPTAPGTVEEEDASEDGNGAGHRPRPAWLEVI